MKTMSAAPSRMGRPGGGASERILRDLSHSNRARVLETTCATEPAGEERWTGTTTPPASQTPAYAARSSGWLEMRTCTGYVDETWAKEHHEYWYDKVKSGKRAPTGGAVPAGAPRMEEEP